MNRILIVITKIKELFSGNKKLLLPLIPLVLFVGMFITIMFFSFLSPQQQQNKNIPPQVTPQVTSQPTPFETEPIPTAPEGFGNDTHVNLNNTSIYEDSENLQKKDENPDGSIKYTLASSDTTRPNIIVVDPQNDVVIFQRTVRDRDNNTLLPQYRDLYGQPEKTFSGSRFYGNTAQTYVFANDGVAFIANPQSNTIFEIHFFLPTTVDNYVQKYGEDIINK